MASGSDAANPPGVEASIRAFWTSRSLPPVGGALGPPSGARVHTMIAPLLGGEAPATLLLRAITADAEVRALAMLGRRAAGRLDHGAAEPAAVRETLPAALPRLGVWVAGGRVGPPPGPDDDTGVQASLDRLASRGLLAAREAPFRSCPDCRSPRTPASILYQEEPGTAYLVRFPLAGADPPTSLLVWTDALWKLLGTTAVLVGADLTYVTVQYSRRGEAERLVTVASSLDRLQAWLPGSEIEIVDKFPGRELEGRRYDHPLASESPMLATLPSPSDAVHASPDVSDTGTGVVALVPQHGATDATVATSLGAIGWPVLGPDLALSRGFVHKYQGLPLDAAESFILRDLTESHRLFAHLLVRRGVPHCAVCGARLIWETGRAWCLDRSRLPRERLELLARLAPGEPVLAADSVPWPVTGRAAGDADRSYELGECASCGKLTPARSLATCTCGGPVAPVRRPILPAFLDALVAWVRETPFPAGEGIRLYVPDRRSGPSLVHALVAMEGADARPGDIRLRRAPTLPPGDPIELGGSADALRVALLGLDTAPRGGPATVASRRQHAAVRLRVAVDLAGTLTAAMRRDGFASDGALSAARISELLPEDRAFLSLFERLRGEVLRLYEAGELPRIERRLATFFDGTFRAGYLRLLHRRLAAPGLPPEKSAAYATLAHLLPAWAELYGPLAPFAGEAVHRAFRGETTSVFERPFTPVAAGLVDEAAERTYHRWRSVSRALDRARRHLGVPAATTLARVVLSVPDEGLASELRAGAEVVARLADIDFLEVASPSLPWEGKRLEPVPVLPEIQRAFGANSARIARLLRGVPGARVREGLRTNSLQLALEGQSVKITASMVELAETLPEGVVAIPWELGELYVTVPAGVPSSDPDRTLPALSPDGYRFVRKVRQRLRVAAKPEALPGIAVWAHGAFGDELERHHAALARYLLVPEIQRVPSAETFPRPEIVVGRSGRGDRWAAWIPGVRLARGTSRSRRRVGAPRVAPPVRVDADDLAAADLLSEAEQTRETLIDEWVSSLDDALGRPLVGPAKLRHAWEAGLRSFDELVHAPYEQLQTVPGFGPFVAAEIVTHFGGAVPPRPVPSRPPIELRFLRAPPRSAPPASPGSGGPPAPDAGERATDGTAASDDPAELVGSPEPAPLPGADDTSAPSTSDPPDGSTPGGSADTLNGDARDPEAERSGDLDATDVPAPDGTSAIAPASERPRLPDRPPAEAPERIVDSSLDESSVPAAGAGSPQLPPDVAPPDAGAGLHLPEAESESGDESAPFAGEAHQGEGWNAPTPPSLEEADRTPSEATDRTGEPEAGASGAATAPTLPPLEPAAAPLAPDPETGLPPVAPSSAPEVEHLREAAAPVLESDPVGAGGDVPASDDGVVSPEERPLTASEESHLQEAADDRVSESPPLADPVAPTPDSGPEPSGEEPPSTSNDAHEAPSRSPSDAVPSAPPSDPSPAANEIGPPSPDLGAAEPDGEVAGPPELGIRPLGGVPEPDGAEPLLADAGTPRTADPGPAPEPAAAEPVSIGEIPPGAVSRAVPAAVIAGEVVVPTEAPSAPAPEEPPSPAAPVPTLSVAADARTVDGDAAVAAREAALTPPAVDPEPAPPPAGPTPGLSLGTGPAATLAWQQFLDACGAGHRGLCLSREFPDRLRALLGPRDVTIGWFSNGNRPGTIRPGDLDALTTKITEDVRIRGVRAVFVDNVELLIRLHGADRVSVFLAQVDGLLKEVGGRGWIPMNPDLLASADRERLENLLPATA